MSHTRNLSTIVLASLVISLSCSQAAHGQKGAPAYDIVPIAPFDFASEAYVNDLNSDGTTAVGTAELVPDSRESFHYDIVNEVYRIYSDGRFLRAVNNQNQMVGHLDDGAACWNGLEAAAIPLDPLDGDAASYAWAINDAGVILGVSVSGREDTGVIWRVKPGTSTVEGPFALPFLSGDTLAQASDLNELAGGVVTVAGSSTNEETGQAVIWPIQIVAGKLVPPTIVHPLDPSGALVYSSAQGINNDGTVVGGVDSFPFRTNEVGELQYLTLPKETFLGSAYGINRHGDIVGRLRISEGRWRRVGVNRAFLWRDGEPIQLDAQISSRAGWMFLQNANNISDTGIIEGYGRMEDEAHYRGFLLLPRAK